MSRTLRTQFFLSSILVVFLGIQSAYGHQLSFKEGATASYTISRKRTETSRVLDIPSAPSDLICSQSTATVVFDIKILSSEKITRWFSHPTYLFTVEVILKKIFLSETDENTTVEYDSTAQIPEHDPVEQALHAIIGIPLHFQIGDQMKETTMYLSNVEHALLLSTKWDSCKSLDLVKEYIKSLFDLSGKGICINHVYSLPCYEELSNNLMRECKVVSESNTYEIHAIESDKTTGSHIELVHIKGPGKKLSSVLDLGMINIEITSKGAVTWNNENSLLQQRNYQIEGFLNSQFFRSKFSESWYVDSHP